MMRTMIAALMAAAVSAENLSEHRRLQASTTCADFNGDALVDVSDLLLLLANFGDSGASAVCDTNGDSAGEGAPRHICSLAARCPRPCPGAAQRRRAKDHTSAAARLPAYKLLTHNLITNLRETLCDALL